MTDYNPTAENDSDAQTENEILEGEAKDAEIVADGGVVTSDQDANSTDEEEIGTPRETKEAIEGASAMAVAQTHWENTLEVTGNTNLDGEPAVSLTIGNAGNPHDAAVVVGMGPSTARELAETLRRRADYAERYAKKKAEEWDKE